MVRLLESQNFLQRGEGLDEGCLESEAGGNQKQEVEQSRDVTEQRLNTIEKNCRELEWRIVFSKQGRSSFYIFGFCISTRA